MEPSKLRGTKAEQNLFTEVSHHYQTAKEDLDVRRRDFDKKDILFRSHIQESSWPYQAMVFDPIIFTSLYEKTARMFANKPQGRMVPREGGDALGAKINNELLSFQWDENERVDAMPMLAKWALMDLNARKYGAAFGLVKWHYERKYTRDKKSTCFFDGPNFKPLVNRDCLANPSYSVVKNWFQYRDYVTIQELESVNDSARSKPIYKNLDILKQSVREETMKGGDRRDANYHSKNKQIKGLTDYLGSDEVYKTLEIVTEYRDNRWIVFSPRHGVVIRDVDNPYKHGQIPVVQLKYYPIDDDLYGLSEIEPVEKLQRAHNAYICQNLDTLNMSTYTPLKVRSTGGAVQMHTLEFGPGKKWLMSDPATDVLPFDSNPQGVGEFVTVYRMMKGAIAEGLGEASAGVSGMVAGESKKTATEIKDTASSRNARDNFNQIFLADAIKKQMLFWHGLNQQYLLSNEQGKKKVLRIVGKEAITYFQKMGLDGEALDDNAIDMLSSDELQGVDVNLKDLTQPMYPVETEEGLVPKLKVSDDNQFGELFIEPEDLSGMYDYIPDIQSMQLPDDTQSIQALKQLVDIAFNPQTAELLAQDSFKLKTKDLLEDYFEKFGLKDADKYFDKLQTQDPYGQEGAPLPTGEGTIEAEQEGMGNGAVGGMAGMAEADLAGQAQPILS